MARMLLDAAMAFLELYQYPKDRIVNLDPDSLIDAFPKDHNLDIYV